MRQLLKDASGGNGGVKYSAVTSGAQGTLLSVERHSGPADGPWGGGQASWAWRWFRGSLLRVK